MQRYDQLFDVRGTAYDRAMRMFPAARAKEFGQVIERAGLLSGMKVADVPAGGGYLAAYLPAGCEWLGHEPCGSFYAHVGQSVDRGADPVSVPLLPLPWTDNSIDVAMSVAGIHHLEDKRPLFAELLRVVKPGGRLVVSDVAVNSAPAKFLDGFVGDHNSTGHEGVFLSAITLDELRDTGWTVISNEAISFCWEFDKEQDMARFCHDLFDLRTASIAETAIAIHQELGVETLPDGGIGMQWELTTVVAEKVVVEK
ncbi:MAG: methyltransferase type 11 [Gammaproteobacteria bacterium BRH_c0]|nr:MAG: methyltransferase type 11 [Gammaproteobacteria bacterium BRH_c0]